VLFALVRWIGGTFLVASLALFPPALVAELVFRKHHPWKEHLIAAAAVAVAIGAVVAPAAWLGLRFPRLPGIPGLAPGVGKGARRPDEPATSMTAQGVASLRAAHQLIDGPPRILDDPISVQLIGPEMSARIQAHPDHLRYHRVAALRLHVLLRSRYAEDRMAVAVQNGVRQCVIIGAGLDTFAYRQPPWGRDLRIFEVDHRASQDTKRGLLENAGVAIPDNLTYVELDIEKMSLKETLIAAGVDRACPVFFTCLGVLVYLTRDAGRDLFRMVAGFPTGSEIVLTYTGSESAEEDPTSLASHARALGEPWLSRYSAEELAGELREAGFGAIEFLSREEATRMVGTRHDGLEPPKRVRIVSARV